MLLLNMAKKTEIIGKDGIKRVKIEIQGSYKNHDGVFEYIIEPDNTVNHRFFKIKEKQYEFSK